MRFTVRCVCWGIFQVVDTERQDPKTGQALVVSTWRSYAGALSNASFRNQHAARA